MWLYNQSTGELSINGEVMGHGYSGIGEGKNNVAMESVPNAGPIPRGLYLIGEPEDTSTHGPCVMHLLPDSGNTMYGRAGFLIHGDSIEHPGCASHGCIILPRPVRNEIVGSPDKTLAVI